MIADIFILLSFYFIILYSWITYLNKAMQITKNFSIINTISSLFRFHYYSYQLYELKTIAIFFFFFLSSLQTLKNDRLKG